MMVELPETVAEWQVSQLYPLVLTCAEWALVTRVEASPWQAAQFPPVTEKDDTELLWEWQTLQTFGSLLLCSAGALVPGAGTA